jgi:acyl-CoA synthetase (NDP forming)
VLATDLAIAQRGANALGYPVAAKLIARGLAHKSELGGVKLGLASDAALETAFGELMAIDVPDREGVLVQKMVSGPLEVFVGMKRDPVFGPVIVVGLGGIYVEVFRETVMRLAPCDATEATQLLESSKFHPLLAGARGKAKLDVAALAALIANVSALALDEPAIESLDLNPVIVDERGVTVVDFKFEACPRDVSELREFPAASFHESGDRVTE